ncbi:MULTISPECIES: F0F1 ATP synthase subunit gamma [Rhodomicrobium]|uniref:F0F1 ATP synthase subunit gamma n=1 Tax=Rhodomicrobium TaxID=1068 RepID=UPI000B4A708F|nr:MULTISPECIES: F0F1 ATP synthase subunit gamma [Rhodomicrobium]
MPSLKDLRNRIASVKATRKITKAMQMVAAAKLRRAQEAAVAARPYAERMNAVLANLNAHLGSTEGASPLLVGTGRDKVHLLIVMTAERGLAGGFNTNVARMARQQIRALQAQGKDVKLLLVGRKGADALRRDYGGLFQETVDLRAVRQIGYAEAQGVARRLLRMFDNGEFDVATLLFSEFKNILTQKPTAVQLIPARLPDAAPVDNSEPHADYEFEPEEEDILRDLLPRNIATQIYRAMLENVAGFYAAQMAAMDSATRNAGDMIEALTLRYNRSRQAQITKELIEIISGAEAL